MKTILGTAALAAAMALATSGPAGAANWVIDFETYFTNPTGSDTTAFLSPPQNAGFIGQDYFGQIVDDEYSVGVTAASGGNPVASGVEARNAKVTIRGSRDRNISSTTELSSFTSSNSEGQLVNRALIFNSDFWTGNDPDLDPSLDISTGTINPSFGNILIVHGSGRCDVANDRCGHASHRSKGPNDDGDGSKLFFEFEDAVNLTGMQVFDTEELGGLVEFFRRDDFDNLVLVSSLALITTGDDKTEFMSFGDDAQNITRMVVKFKGSGGLDRITGDVVPPPPGDEVPEPAALALMLAGLAGLGVVRRRRNGIVS